MPQFLSTSNLSTILSAVASVGSGAYNLYNSYKNQQYQNNLRSFAQNPQKMDQYAAQFTQPLNAGLEKSVANQTQAYLAQRGLSDSPQISEQVEAQAIAPYIQQNQQQGYQDALQALNLGGGAINPALQQQQGVTSLASALSQLMGLKSLSSIINPIQQQGWGNAASIPIAAPTLPDQIPNQPLQGLDLSSFYQPDYAMAGGGSGGTGGTGSPYGINSD